MLYSVDLVFTNQEYAIDEIKSSAPLGKSDHMVLTWNYQLHSDFSTSQARTPKHNFNRGRYEEMSRELEGASWRLSDNMTIDMMWNRIKKVLDASIERHIPLMKKQSAQKNLLHGGEEIDERSETEAYTVEKILIINNSSQL